MLPIDEENGLGIAVARNEGVMEGTDDGKVVANDDGDEEIS